LSTASAGQSGVFLLSSSAEDELRCENGHFTFACCPWRSVLAVFFVPYFISLKTIIL